MEENDKLTSRRVRCPLCKKKTRIKVNENTVLLKFPLFCPKCGKETIINVMNFQMQIDTEPDA